MSAYVYLIDPKVTPYVKIGYWSGTVKSLRSRYRTCYGDFDMTVFETRTPREVESILLTRFVAMKYRGELFDRAVIPDFLEYAGTLCDLSCKRQGAPLSGEDIHQIRNLPDCQHIDINEFFHNLQLHAIDAGFSNLEKVVDMVNTWHYDDEFYKPDHELGYLSYGNIARRITGSFQARPTCYLAATSTAVYSVDISEERANVVHSIVKEIENELQCRLVCFSVTVAPHVYNSRCVMITVPWKGQEEVSGCADCIVLKTEYDMPRSLPCQWPEGDWQRCTP